MVRARANPGDAEQLLLNTATRDGKRVTIGFGQDPGQAGKSQAQHLVRALSGLTVRPATESGGDKLTRSGRLGAACKRSGRSQWRTQRAAARQRFDQLKVDPQWFQKLRAGDATAAAEYERLNRDLAG